MLLSPHHPIHQDTFGPVLTVRRQPRPSPDNRKDGTMDETRKRRWILYGLMPALVTFGIAFAQGLEAPFPEPDHTLIRQAGLGKDGETRAFADDVLPWISEQ